MIPSLLVLFAILAAASMRRHAPLAGDLRLADALLAHRGNSTWRVADAISFVASGPVVAMIAVAAAAGLLIARRRVVDALAVVAAPAVAGVVEVAMKVVVSRPRPLTAALTGESGNGFPSGHVTGFAALAVVLLIALARSAEPPSRRLRVSWSIVAAASIVAVMWSRVALGAHYPSDAVGGALLGTAVGLMSLPAAHRLVAMLRSARPSREAPLDG